MFHFYTYLGRWSNLTNSTGLKPPTSCYVHLVHWGSWTHFLTSMLDELSGSTTKFVGKWFQISWAVLIVMSMILIKLQQDRVVRTSQLHEHCVPYASRTRTVATASQGKPINKVSKRRGRSWIAHWPCLRMYQVPSSVRKTRRVFRKSRRSTLSLLTWRNRGCAFGYASVDTCRYLLPQRRNRVYGAASYGGNQYTSTEFTLVMQLMECLRRRIHTYVHTYLHTYICTYIDRKAKFTVHIALAGQYQTSWRNFFALRWNQRAPTSIHLLRIGPRLTKSRLHDQLFRGWLGISTSYWENGAGWISVSGFPKCMCFVCENNLCCISYMSISVSV